MTRFFETIRCSYEEMKNLRTLTTTALLTALGVLLGFLALIPSPFLHFSINFLITGTMGFLFGPIPAMLGATAINLINFFLHPTGSFFFGFTLNATLTGAIYGLILYRRPVKLWRCAAAKASVSLIINVLLSTLWLSMLYGKAFAVLLPARLIKNAAALPFESAAMWLVLSAVEKIRQRIRH